MAQTLDIEEQQVAIDFFNDAQYQWHARVLLRRLDPGRWLAATPDYEVETLVVGDHRVQVLPRNAPFPAR
eukprot:5802488-Lingulodinium_polyedra.AAC.1